MANQKVTLMRYCRVDEGERAVWKRYPAAFGKNGKIRPDYVVINAQKVHCPTGHYELRYYEGSKLRYENVGKNAQTARIKKLAKEKTLAARSAADVAGIMVVEQEGRKNLRKEADLYVKDRENAGRMEASRQAKNALDEFIGCTKKTFIDELKKDDVYNFHAVLRKRGLTPRTIANKHQRLSSFLRFAGVNVKALMPEKPKYEKALPTVYTPQEVGELLQAADEYMRLVIELGLKCGLRELEIVYLEWSDIHWQDKILRVQGKPYWGFTVKDSEQRDVPIPDDLLAHLETWKEGARYGQAHSWNQERWSKHASVAPIEAACESSGSKLQSVRRMRGGNQGMRTMDAAQAQADLHDNTTAQWCRRSDGNAVHGS